jgi:hypothetical protein
VRALRTAATRLAGVAGIALAAALVIPAHSASAMAGWQDWGAWQRETPSGQPNIQCRNYVDASTVGSRILISGYFECNGGVGGSVAVAGGGVIKTKYCFAAEIEALGSCYLSFYVSNPSGSQSFIVTTTSHILGDPEAARIAFSA